MALSGAITLSPLACAGPEGTVAGGGFQPTVTIEGNVTTIVNGSGSLWVGSARLIEEASIGVETGAAEYMFGRPGGVKDPECDDKHDPDDFPYYSRNYRCWRDQPLIDVFDAEGVYLGHLEVPEGIVLNSIAPPLIRGDTVVAALYEPDGVIRVKRYRIAPPDGQ